MNNEAVQDWLRVRRELLEQENSFTSLALQAISGEVSEMQLQAAREHLEEMRSLCSAAYERAFPIATAQRGQPL